MDAWKALLDAPLEKLVAHTPEGIAIQPLYVDGPEPVLRPGSGRFGVCVRSDAAQLDEDLDGGADAVLLDTADREALLRAAQRGAGVVLESEPRPADPSQYLRGLWSGPGPDPSYSRVAEVSARMPLFWTGFDLVDLIVRDGARGDLLQHDLPFEMLVKHGLVEANDAKVKSVAVSGIGFHECGADAADELALIASSLVAKLRTAARLGVEASHVGRNLWLQIAVGRDTFGELCKLRALRVVIGKLLTAAGSDAVPPVHAVCSSRTESQRDPWVNMLRVSTEIFAAALGGADLVTPLPFDAALGPPSAHARRVARNSALVLREESHLGRVIDAAGGSYYIESRTDALAREAWARFQQIERDGGIVAMIASGRLRERLDASWALRAAAIAKRKESVLGVSEFANLDEVLPVAVPATAAVLATTTATATEAEAAALAATASRTRTRAGIGAVSAHAAKRPPLIAHRDAEGFEALRTRVEHGKPLRVALVTLGEPKDYRARVGFASGLFATAGLRSTEATLAEAAGAEIACICGSDERYAAEAASIAASLRATGAIKIVLAGRPGALETELRAAGVNAFIYMGCDVLATIAELLS